MTTTTDLDIIDCAEVATICGVSVRTVYDWIRRGVMEGEVRISSRPLWRRSTIEAWCEAGRPAGRIAEFAPAEPFPGLMGREDVADHCGIESGSVYAWINRDKVPEPDVRLAGIVAWLPSTIEAWECGSRDHP